MVSKSVLVLKRVSGVSNVLGLRVFENVLVLDSGLVFGKHIGVGNVWKTYRRMEDAESVFSLPFIARRGFAIHKLESKGIRVLREIE